MISRGPPFARTLSLLATLSAVTPRQHCAAAVAATAAARSAVLQLSSVLSCRHAFASLPFGPAGRAEQGRGTCSVRHPARTIAVRPTGGVLLAAMSHAGGMVGSVKRKAPATALAPGGARSAKRGKHSASGGEGAMEEGPDETGLDAAEDNDEGAGPFKKGKASGYSAATDLYHSKSSIKLLDLVNNKGTDFSEFLSGPRNSPPRGGRSRPRRVEGQGCVAAVSRRWYGAVYCALPQGGDGGHGRDAAALAACGAGAQAKGGRPPRGHRGQPCQGAAAHPQVVVGVGVGLASRRV